MGAEQPKAQGHVDVRDALASAAYINGRRLGLQGVAASLVQGEPGSIEHAEGLRGWQSGNAERAYDDAMRSAA